MTNHVPLGEPLAFLRVGISRRTASWCGVLMGRAGQGGLYALISTIERKTR